MGLGGQIWSRGGRYGAGGAAMGLGEADMGLGGSSMGYLWGWGGNYGVSMGYPWGSYAAGVTYGVGVGCYRAGDDSYGAEKKIWG